MEGTVHVGSRRRGQIRFSGRKHPNRYEYQLFRYYMGQIFITLHFVHAAKETALLSANFATDLLSRPELLICTSATSKWQISMLTTKLRPSMVLEPVEPEPIVANDNCLNYDYDAPELHIPGDEHIPIGSSKAGGFADLPTSWEDFPDVDGCNPRLLLQINFAELKHCTRSSLKLPPKGILYVLSSGTGKNDMSAAFVRFYDGPCDSLSQELSRTPPTNP